jgi:hypothetical protein
MFALKICKEGTKIEEERGKKEGKKMFIDAKPNIF